MNAEPVPTNVELLFPQRDDNMLLWRYMKLSTFFLLLEGKAFFPSVATLQKDDPLEGALNQELEEEASEELMGRLEELCGENVDSLEQWLKQRAEVWQKPVDYTTHTLAEIYLRELAKRRAVWCWFSSRHESAAMWSVYANAGIAIGTTLGNLWSALPQKRKFQIAQIIYADRNDRSMSYTKDLRYKDRIHRPHLIKGKEYEHEQEIRVITTCWYDQRGRLIDDINGKVLIKTVLFSPLLPRDEAMAVQALIEAVSWPNGKPEIRRSSILGRKAQEEESIARISDAVRDAFPDDERDLPPPLNSL